MSETDVEFGGRLYDQSIIDPPNIEKFENMSMTSVIATMLSNGYYWRSRTPIRGKDWYFSIFRVEREREVPRKEWELSRLVGIGRHEDLEQSTKRAAGWALISVDDSEAH